MEDVAYLVFISNQYHVSYLDFHPSGILKRHPRWGRFGLWWYPMKINSGLSPWRTRRILLSSTRIWIPPVLSVGFMTLLVLLGRTFMGIYWIRCTAQGHAGFWTSSGSMRSLSDLCFLLVWWNNDSFCCWCWCWYHSPMLCIMILWCLIFNWSISSRFLYSPEVYCSMSKRLFYLKNNETFQGVASSAYQDAWVCSGSLHIDCVELMCQINKVPV